MVDGAECKTIDPAAAEVGDVNVLRSKGEWEGLRVTVQQCKHIKQSDTFKSELQAAKYQIPTRELTNANTAKHRLSPLSVTNVHSI